MTHRRPGELVTGHWSLVTSPLLALFTRSLREDVRGKAAYRARTGLCGFILLMLMALAAADIWTGAPGKTFFISIISLQAVAITFVGLSYFASAIAEEKEEQTLGLLRMTNLDPLSILLGKSTSRLCGALLLLAAQIPFTVFAVTLGGISLGQIAAAYCTLAAYTFLLCNIALLGSVLARRTSGAAAFSVIVIALLISAGPVFGAVGGKLRSLGVPFGLDRVGDMLWSATPIARLSEVLGTGFSGPPAGWQVASNLALGVGCFLLAWLAFERFCDHAAEEAGQAVNKSLRSLNPRPRRKPRPGAHPLVWKDFHFLCGGSMGLKIRVAAYIGLPLVLGVLSPQTIFPLFASLVSFAFSIDAGAMAARMFRTELNDQTLSALALLPCTMRDIARRKALACLLAATPGLLAMVGGNIALIIAREVMGGVIGYSGMMIAQMISGWIHVIFLVQIVAWLSLYMKRGALPVGYVLAMAINALISMLAMAVAFGATFAGGASNAAAMYAAPVAIAALNLVATVIFYRLSLSRLEELVGET